MALNGLQHGGRTDRLPEKLRGAAGDWEGQALYRWFQGEITATFGRGRPQEERWADQNCGCGVVPGARGGALTSKAGMSFRFMGIMLATPPSIKDSGGGRAGEDGARVLGATTSLRDAAAAGGGDPGRGFARNPAPGELAGTVAGAGSASAPTRPSPWERVPFPGTAAVTPLRVPATQGRTQEIRQNPEPRLLTHERVRPRRCFLSVYIRSEPSQEKRRPSVPKLPCRAPISPNRLDMFSESRLYSPIRGDSAFPHVRVGPTSEAEGLKTR